MDSSYQEIHLSLEDVDVIEVRCRARPTRHELGIQRIQVRKPFRDEILILTVELEELVIGERVQRVIQCGVEQYRKAIVRCCSGELSSIVVGSVVRRAYGQV